MAEISILKADGKKEPFRASKLSDSLARAGADKGLTQSIISHVQRELINDMSTADIYHHAFSLLKQAHKPAAARYSLRRALLGFGPTGFPFEEYVAEIFKAQGFEAVNDQIIKGVCVEHEVDVVAWNEHKLIAAEVKFHNELGLKSDLKVALYVKARIDDLRGTGALTGGPTGASGVSHLTGQFFYGGRQRTLDEGWLITNTKFSERALLYGRCAGMKMIGWNYPKQGHGHEGNPQEANLQDLIERFRLHPVSCLVGLSVHEKQELFARKIVLCRSLVDDPNILPTLGLTPQRIAEVSEEIRGLAL